MISGGDADEQKALRFAFREALGHDLRAGGFDGRLCDAKRRLGADGGDDDARAAGV